MGSPAICFINPNSTESMTSTCRDTLDRITVAGGASFEFITNHAAPEAIQGAEDGELATKAMLTMVAKLSGDYAAFVVGCFDDTGVWDLTLNRLGDLSSGSVRPRIIGRHSFRNDLSF